MPIRLALAALLMAVIQPATAAAPVPVELAGGQASEVEHRDDESALHRASGFVFPKKAGALTLGKLVVYGPGNVSGTYYASGKPGDTLLSLYIYPAKQSLAAEVEGTVYAIGVHWIAKRIPAPIALPLPGDVASGWFDLSDEKSPSRSLFVIARRGDWFVKARLTLASGASAPELAIVQAAIADLPLREHLPAPVRDR